MYFAYAASQHTNALLKQSFDRQERGAKEQESDVFREKNRNNKKTIFRTFKNEVQEHHRS